MKGKSRVYQNLGFYLKNLDEFFRSVALSYMKRREGASALRNAPPYSFMTSAVPLSSIAENGFLKALEVDGL